MFELTVFLIGLLVTTCLAIAKLAAWITLGWLGVLVPLLIALVIIALIHGACLCDVFD